MELEMVDHNITDYEETIYAALHRICDGDIPDSLEVQYFIDEDNEEQKEGWCFTDDPMSNGIGFLTMSQARENQLLDELRIIERVESTELYEDWLERVSDEIARNWDYYNTCYL